MRLSTYGELHLTLRLTDVRLAELAGNLMRHSMQQKCLP
jgi:hypothetical protein